MTITKSNITLLYLTIPLLLLLFFSGCKSPRTILKKPIKQEGAEYIVDSLVKNYYDYSNFSTKLSVKIKNGKTTSVRAQLRILKDSIIWASIIPAMGMEAVRVKLTPDSVFLVNRLDKTYYKGNYDILTTLLGIDIHFFDIQALLTTTGYSLIPGDNYKASIDNSNYRLNIKREYLKFPFTTNTSLFELMRTAWIDADYFAFSKIKIKEKVEGERPFKFSISYNEYELVDKIRIPESAIIDYSGSQSGYHIELKYNNVHFNREKLKTSFSIPKKYTPITIPNTQ